MVNGRNQLRAGCDRGAQRVRVAWTGAGVCDPCRQSHGNDEWRLVRGSSPRRVDTVIVSVHGSHRECKSSALGTICRVLCAKTLMVCSRIVSSTSNDTNTTLGTVCISHSGAPHRIPVPRRIFLQGGARAVGVAMKGAISDFLPMYNLARGEQGATSAKRTTSLAPQHHRRTRKPGRHGHAHTYSSDKLTPWPNQSIIVTRANLSSAVLPL
jgi:hypothetical protein